MNQISTVTDYVNDCLEHLVHETRKDGVPELAVWIMIRDLSHKHLRDMDTDDCA